ncbi:MAG: hypothetical protein HKO08_04255 [Erythrobacter sp.]|nr:hypothetical protein [Erythrobacter sp.]
MEQVLVFVSIVLGVALAFELSNLDKLLRSKRVRWHWAQPLFALFVLLSIMSIWWMIAGREIEGPMTLGRFLPLMWVLVILNLLAAASLPNDIPEEGIDLAQYYQENRRYLWGLYGLFFLPLGVNWFVYAAKQAQSIEQFFAYAGGDMMGLALILYLFFARNWWAVALGFVGIGVITGSWMFRAL